MRKSLIIYRDRLGIGGSERVLSALVELFRSLGFHVTVLSFGGLWDTNYHGQKPHQIINILDYRYIDMLPSYKYSRFIRNIYTLFYEFIAKYSYDIIIDSAYNDLRGTVDLGYVHYLYRRYLCGDYKFKLNDMISYLLDIYYSAPKSAKIIAANSSWTLKKIMECGFSGVIVHPPVDPVDCPATADKDDLVVGLGRLGKPWEEFIEIAKRVKTTRPSVSFVIMGSTEDPHRAKYLESLGGGAVKIMPNVDEKTKREVLCKAKVLLHTHPAEHFGIAVVEAMYAGAVPVVHRNGGAWYDIVAEGRYGYGYDDIEEATVAVLDALNNEQLRCEVRDRAKKFSKNSFKQKIQNLLKL
ncbi:MAG: glycosyltransferase family 4 protein [Thermoproteus sp.]